MNASVMKEIIAYYRDSLSVNHVDIATTQNPNGTL